MGFKVNNEKVDEILNLFSQLNKEEQSLVISKIMSSGDNGNGITVSL